MAAYSVADAKNKLSQLIELALKGEEVVITRHGNPVVTLRPVAKPSRPVSAADLDWLAAHRVGRIPPAEDAGTLVSKLRDEEER